CSLLLLDEKREAAALDDPHLIAQFRSALAARFPKLALDPHLPYRAAWRHDLRPCADQRLRSHPHAVPLGEPDPEKRLADLDHRGDTHQHEPPRRGDDEDGEDDCDDEKHAGGEIRTHTPFRAEDFKSVPYGGGELQEAESACSEVFPPRDELLRTAPYGAKPVRASVRAPSGKAPSSFSASAFSGRALGAGREGG